MDTFIQDVRFALRSLLRQRSFTVTALLTLALGIGATTAMFSVVDGILLRPLPIPRADRVVAILNDWTKLGKQYATVSAPDFHDWHDASRSFAAMAYYTGGETSVTVDGHAEYGTVYRVTPEFFRVLGARAQVGRLLSPAELAPGGPLAVVITDRFWRRQFQGDIRALGRTMSFQNQPFTIVGVLPAHAQYPSDADVYCAAASRTETTSRSAHNYRVVARLADGVSLEQANAEIVSISRRLEAEYPATNADKLAVVVPLQAVVVGTMRRTILVLFGAVGLVLMIACANVANLLLSRSTAREREMVVRAAVGAGRGRLVRQLLTESAVLGVTAGLGGAWLARLGMLALLALAPPGLPRVDEIRVDMTALLFAVCVSLAASLLFGLAPALQASRVQLADGIRQGGKGTRIGARGTWARNVFVVAEVALSVVLVSGAALLARSLSALAAVDMGFATEQLLVLRSTVPINGRADAERATAFYRDLLAELRVVPGVTAVSGASGPPTKVRSNGGYWLEGGPGPDQTGIRAPQALFNVITPDYFRTLETRVIAGRDFTAADTLDAPPVAIINESLSRESFGGEDPIGRRLRCGLDRPDFMTIVGVVADIRSRGPAQPFQAEIFMPYQQHPGFGSALTILARTGTPDPLALADTLRRTIAARNPNVPVTASTMEMTLDTARSTPRFQAFLVAAFAGVALVLAVAGVYGVMAYSVGQRVPEFGIRIALGATPARIFTGVLAQGGRLALTGMTLGVLLSVLSGKAIQALLFGVTARDPNTLGAVLAVVAVATLGACYVPARRAVRIDPMVAMRTD